MQPSDSVSSVPASRPASYGGPTTETRSHSTPTEVAAKAIKRTSSERLRTESFPLPKLHRTPRRGRRQSVPEASHPNVQPLNIEAVQRRISGLFSARAPLVLPVEGQSLSERTTGLSITPPGTPDSDSSSAPTPTKKRRSMRRQLSVTRILHRSRVSSETAELYPKVEVEPKNLDLTKEEQKLLKQMNNEMRKQAAPPWPDEVTPRDSLFIQKKAKDLYAAYPKNAPRTTKDLSTRAWQAVTDVQDSLLSRLPWIRCLGTLHDDLFNALQALLTEKPDWDEATALGRRLTELQVELDDVKQRPIERLQAWVLRVLNLPPATQYLLTSIIGDAAWSRVLHLVSRKSRSAIYEALNHHLTNHTIIDSLTGLTLKFDPNDLNSLKIWNISPEEFDAILVNGKQSALPLYRLAGHEQILRTFLGEGSSLNFSQDQLTVNGSPVFSKKELKRLQEAESSVERLYRFLHILFKKLYSEEWCDPGSTKIRSQAVLLALASMCCKGNPIWEMLDWAIEKLAHDKSMLLECKDLIKQSYVAGTNPSRPPDTKPIAQARSVWSQPLQKRIPILPLMLTHTSNARRLTEVMLRKLFPDFCCRAIEDKDYRSSFVGGNTGIRYDFTRRRTTKRHVGASQTLFWEIRPRQSGAQDAPLITIQTRISFITEPGTLHCRSVVLDFLHIGLSDQPSEELDTLLDLFGQWQALCVTEESTNNI